MGIIAEKDIRLSNIKGLLIFLVVFGHLMELYKREYYELFVFIYAFHMPLFIFISGYLAKRMKLSKIVNLLLLYLIFQCIFEWFLFLIGDHQTLQFHFGIPQFHLWYIVSLGFWYGIAWIISKVKFNTLGKWLVFLFIFIICFISRWYTDAIVEYVRQYYEGFSSYTLSFQRTLTFMPFFFAGFFIDKKLFEKGYSLIVSKKAQLILGFTSMFLVFIYIQSTPGLESIFRGSFGTHRFMAESEGVSIYTIKILTHYSLAGWISLLIINCVSEKKSILTKWGDHSLTIFLFHPVLVFIIGRMEFMSEWEADLKVLSFLIMAIGISYVLGSSSFMKLTKYICQPYKALEKLVQKIRP